MSESSPDHVRLDEGITRKVSPDGIIRFSSTRDKNEGSIGKRISRIRRKGVRFHLGDFYFWLLDASLPQLVAGMLVYFIIVSLVFAGLFAAVPGELERNGEHVHDFATTFYISLSIISDTADLGVEPGVVGAGKMAILLIAGIWQLISLAAFIALLVDRLTKPHSRMVFSKVAVLGSFNGHPALTFRLAHERKNILLDAEVRLNMFVGYKTLEGWVGRRPVELKLARNKMPFLGLNWVLHHPIDEHSPLRGYLRYFNRDENGQCILEPSHLVYKSPSGEDMCALPSATDTDITGSAAEASHADNVRKHLSSHIGATAVAEPLSSLEIFVSFQAVDETQRETLRASHSYCIDNIVGQARFADMLLRQDALSARGAFETLDLSVIDDVLPLRPEDVEAEARAVQKRLEHRRISAAARQARKSGARSSQAGQVVVADFQGHPRYEHHSTVAAGSGHVTVALDTQPAVQLVPVTAPEGVQAEAVPTAAQEPASADNVTIQVRS